MKKENVRKLLEVKKEVRYNDKISELLDDVIVDECGENVCPMPKMVAIVEKQLDDDKKEEDANE